MNDINTIRVRAITLGIPLAQLGGQSAAVRSFFNHAEAAFTANSFEVQTRRLVFEPLQSARNEPQARILSTLQSASAKAAEAGVRWCCCPIEVDANFARSEASKAVLPIVQRIPNMFLHFLATRGHEVQLGALAEVARCILAISRLSPSGYDNFRVGVGSRINPNTPFFPFSWHDGEAGFSIAVENMGFFHSLLDADFSAMSPAEKEAYLAEKFIPHYQTIDTVAREIAAATGFAYKGLDTSLAPFPDALRSVASLVEKMAPERCGGPGTLSATAFCTQLLRRIIREGGLQSVGFNGVMYSPLEDKRLASLLGRGVDMAKLLLFSTVCGCGIDMVPIAGTTLPEDLASLLQDVAALALALDKPLGVRVLPIPNGRMNEMTAFNHDFLVNCRIQELDGQGLMHGKLLNILPRIGAVHD